MTTYNETCSNVLAALLTVYGVTMPLAAAAYWLFDTVSVPNMDYVNYAVMMSVTAVSCFWYGVFKGSLKTILSFLTPAKNMMEA